MSIIITGYEIGTEVQWQDDTHGGFQTGIVRSRYYDPDCVEINGETIEIEVVGNSPTYVVEEADDGDVIVIDHTKVIRQHVNDHT